MHPYLLEFISYSSNEMNYKEPTSLFSCPADATFIPLCNGVSGTIGALTTIGENYEHDTTTSILIDNTVVNLTNQVDDDDDISVVDLTA
jgi:hypothetical protein